jgi:hypothetical protein
MRLRVVGEPIVVGPAVDPTHAALIDEPPKR